MNDYDNNINYYFLAYSMTCFMTLFVSFCVSFCVNFYDIILDIIFKVSLFSVFLSSVNIVSTQYHLHPTI